MISISVFYVSVFIYMNTWMTGKKSNETSLPEKEYFYSHLNTEDITDADYLHTKKNYKGFEIKHLG